jgi:hypothetical protein
LFFVKKRGLVLIKREMDFCLIVVDRQWVEGSGAAENSGTFPEFFKPLTYLVLLGDFRLGTQGNAEAEVAIPI